jgi:hypothetical protein
VLSEGVLCGSRVAYRYGRKELMLWGNASVRLPVALHLVLQAVSPCRQRAHDCVDAWYSSRLKKAALELDQITGSELMCCHGTTPFFSPGRLSYSPHCGGIGKHGALADVLRRRRRRSRCVSGRYLMNALWIAHLRQTGQRHRLPYWAPFSPETEDADILAAFVASGALLLLLEMRHLAVSGVGLANVESRIPRTL